MPDQPLWLKRIPIVLSHLRTSEEADWTTAQLASLLAVSQRRAQQILQPIMSRTIGHIALIRRIDAIQFFDAIARGDAVAHDTRRRQRLAEVIGRLQPRLLVEAPVSIIETRLDSLPGIVLSPGRIVIEDFRTSQEALEKLLALALAIGNGQSTFEELVTVKPATGEND